MKKNIIFWLMSIALANSATSFAAEQMDEKQYAPAPVPRVAEPPLIQGTAPETAPDIVVPGRQEDGRTIVVPSAPEKPAPVISLPAIPGTPGIPETPGSPAPAKVIVLPDTSRPDVIVEQPDKSARPRTIEEKKPDAAPPVKPEQAQQKNMLTPGSFLPLTPQKDTPKNRAQQTKSPEADVKPQKEQTQKEKQPPRKGEALKIPEDAAKNGKLDFLEGCWVGTRPEYGTKRIVKERFCFDKNGVGKRYIYDPKYAGECVGATKALINSGGVLRMNSSKMFCTSGDIWGASEMTCQGEGNQTPCTWVFRDIKNAQQSYKIQFVRE